MLKTTQKLLEYLENDNQQCDLTIIVSLVNSILISGGKQDAEAVLKQYVADPYRFDHIYLLPVFRKFGDDSIAEQLFNTVIHHNELHKDASPEVLETIGYLNHAPIKPILADYIFSKKQSDYYTSKYAVLGLLHFDCTEYELEIKKEIEKCYGQNLFPEFIPALVCKLTNKTDVLEKLYELGNDYASTDCNSGILLGFSLCGEFGKHYFTKALFNQNWETSSTSTSTLHFAYEGLKNLNIRFKELYKELKSTENLDTLDVFLALLRKRVEDIEIHQQESFVDIFTTLFGRNSGNETGTFVELASNFDRKDQAYEIQKLVELRMNEELVLSNYII